MIDVLIKALRSKATELNQTADSLERLGSTLGPLFSDDKDNKSKAVQAITKRMSENIVAGFNDAAHYRSKRIKELIPDMIPSYVEEKKVNSNKGYKYPAGQHWTQKPENVNKLKKVVKRLQKARKETGKFNQHTK